MYLGVESTRLELEAGGDSLRDRFHRLLGSGLGGGVGQSVT